MPPLEFNLILSCFCLDWVQLSDDGDNGEYEWRANRNECNAKTITN